MQVTGGSRTNKTEEVNGAYVRVESGFRNTIEEGTKYPPEAGRYHLYVALACPWACGTLQALRYKGLEDVISVSIVHPTWQRTKPDDEEDKHCGWVFRKPGDAPLKNSFGFGSLECDDALIPDTVNNFKFVRDLYEKANDTVGKYSTPVLWDKKTSTIVNNESMEILRIFNDKFNKIAKNPTSNMYPDEGGLKEKLEELNKIVYPNINNGVYRCGFAKTQEVYDQAIVELYDALDKVESMLQNQRYLGGDIFTWLDLRLFNTLVRFDEVYSVYFKTNKKLIREYPNLLNYCKDVFQIPAIGGAINMKHIKMHYYTAHPTLNHYGIIPAGQTVDFSSPHDRDRFGNR